MDIEEAFELHRSLLVALSYRLTGDIEDAEESVQETFVRALEQPPPRGADPWKPWLVRVATNISLDAIRRRKRRAYPGPWLPSPLPPEETESLLGRAASDVSQSADPGSQYELRESATLAFLVALETLPPRQRAALVLGDAFGLSAREIGSVMGASEGGVRMLIHRARRTIRSARPHGGRSFRDLERDVRAVLPRLLELLVRCDVEGLAAILSRDVELRTDSGGHVTALREPMVGAGRVARLLARVALRRFPRPEADLLVVNGLPALWIEFESTQRRQAPRALLGCDLDEHGAACELFAIVNPHKLARVREPVAASNPGAPVSGSCYGDARFVRSA